MPRRHIADMYASVTVDQLTYNIAGKRLIGLAMTLTSDLENLFSTAHSHAEYLWQVLSKSIHQLQRYRVAK